MCSVTRVHCSGLGSADSGVNLIYFFVLLCCAPVCDIALPFSLPRSENTIKNEIPNFYFSKPNNISSKVISHFERSSIEY